jgi:hypothetical protein
MIVRENLDEYEYGESILLIPALIILRKETGTQENAGLSVLRVNFQLSSFISQGRQKGEAH